MSLSGRGRGWRETGRRGEATCARGGGRQGRRWSGAATSRGLPGATGSWGRPGRIFSPKLQGECGPADTDFGPLASSAVRKYPSVALSHEVCARVLQQPQGTHTHERPGSVPLPVLGILSLNPGTESPPPTSVSSLRPIPEPFVLSGALLPAERAPCSWRGGGEDSPSAVLAQGCTRWPGWDTPGLSTVARTPLSQQEKGNQRRPGETDSMGRLARPFWILLWDHGALPLPLLHGGEFPAAVRIFYRHTSQEPGR